LQKMGARNVLISMAGDGAMLVDENGERYRIGVPKGTVRNSVGAGDSMVAGFVAGYMKTKNYDTALKMGTAAGSATAFSDGLAKKADIDALFKTLN
ncbi:MAG: 1-phosphofructokinase, partial [Pseudobutyrivibrio sp.]|nr:1-phosphofructokinase [Pseudobutyrivibrio sp.]